jgi:hypothetical protein
MAWRISRRPSGDNARCGRDGKKIGNRMGVNHASDEGKDWFFIAVRCQGSRLLISFASMRSECLVSLETELDYHAVRGGRPLLLA